MNRTVLTSITARTAMLFILFCVLGFLCASKSAKADEPYFDLYAEFDANSSARQPKNSAFALGKDNYGWLSYGYSTAENAKQAALQACNQRVDKFLKLKGSQTCKLVSVNEKIIWSGERPKTIAENILPEPDLPLINAYKVGDPSTSKAILLSLYGCDKPDKEPPDWISSWYSYFRARNFAVIQPDSYADPHADVCPDKKASLKSSDEVYRLRIAQTSRTVKILKAKYPNKPIYIWGHSQGAWIAQLLDQKVAGVILSGDTCNNMRLLSQTPVLLVLGEKDQYVTRPTEWGSVSTKKVFEKCPAFKKSSKRKFVIVGGADHYTAIWDQKLIDAISKFLGEKSYNLAFEKWNDLIPSGAHEAQAYYALGKGHKAWAIRPGANSVGFASTSWDNQSDAEQAALAECERGAAYQMFIPDLPRACKLVSSQ